MALLAGAVLVAGVFVALAVRSLQGEVARTLAEHRRVEQELFYLLKQTVHLEGTDTREAVEDSCRASVPGVSSGQTTEP